MMKTLLPSAKTAVHMIRLIQPVLSTSSVFQSRLKHFLMPREEITDTFFTGELCSPLHLYKELILWHNYGKAGFKKELAKETNDFNSSISFDSRMFEEDINGQHCPRCKCSAQLESLIKVKVKNR